MNEPIIEFKDEVQAYECLKEWQSRLFLDDWIIKIDIDVDFSNKEFKQACIEKNHVHKTALISFEKLGSRDCYVGECTKLQKWCSEKTLVHELLHILFDFDKIGTSIETNEFNDSQHQKLEFMARSLIMAKYNIPHKWFMNI